MEAGMRKKAKLTVMLAVIFAITAADGGTANKEASNRSLCDVNEVLIGYFGPATPSNSRGYGMYSAASLAIQQANKEGGYKGLPFRLVPGWSANPWKSGAAQIVRMAYVHKVRAIIGGVDGPSTHLAEQVAAKARLTLISPASTDRSVNAANVPWMFSCLPGDHLQAPVLVDAIAALAEGDPFILVSAVNHDSHLLTVELKKSLARNRLVPHYHFDFEPGRKDYTLLVRKIVQAKPRVLVLIAAADESARLIHALRKRKFQRTIVGGPAMGCRSFLENTGNAADGVVLPLLYSCGEELNEFERKMVSRCGNRPDYLAAHTYDAVNILIEAIRKAGLDREQIRDAIRELSPRHGVTGRLEWDSIGGNVRPVSLGIIRNGSILAFSVESSHVERPTSGYPANTSNSVSAFFQSPDTPIFRVLRSSRYWRCFAPSGYFSPGP